MPNVGSIDFDQLTTAVDWSIKQFETPRQKRVEAVKDFVGYHYSSEGSDKRMPVNLLELAVTIYIHQLAAQAPRVLISTSVPQLKPFARNMEIALNQVPEDIDLGKTVRRSVLEALFSYAVVKVGLNYTGKTEMGYEYGEPFVDLVSIDDYFCDMSAKSREEIQFEGNDYWMPHDQVEQIKQTDELIESDDFTVTGNEGEERADGISKDEGADLYKEKVWLRDVWLVNENKLVTYTVKTRKLIRVVDWDGPDGGPYHVLGFSDVPGGNILPLPPVSLWRDLNELANNLFRKLGNQADAKKTVAGFSGENDDSVEALRDASDGDGIAYRGQEPKNITVGGIDAPSLAFFLQTRDIYSYLAGNLDTLGGLSPMADTVGQEGMINDAANARISYMRGQTVDFVRGIYKAIAWYEWTDPVRERIIEKPVKGTNIVLRRRWSAETRDGDFLDYNIDIDIYSMQDDSPSVKLQKIGTMFDRYIVPLLPMIQQQGGQVDVQRLLSILGEYGNLPEIEELIKFEQAPQGQQMQGNPQPEMFKPASTKRTYERVNRPGATRSGKDDVMSRILMGGGVQDSEAQSLGRSET